MKSKAHPWRVLLKAVFLFALANVIFAFLDPPLGKITLYNSVLPGRLRFPYEQAPQFYLTGYNAPVYEDFDAMFGAHVISKKKSAEEFRLIFIGDSSTWGINVQATETVVEQINRRNIQTCDGRTVRAYNLGYPMPLLVRDVIVLDKAMEYQPDMVFWLITLYTLEPKTSEIYFIAPHMERYLKLTEAYDLHPAHLAQPVQEPSFWERTIIGQRKRLKNIMLTQAFGVLWAATGIDNHEGLQPDVIPVGSDVEDDVKYEGQLPEKSADILDSLLLDVLSAGLERTGNVPVVLVNEPIFVAEGRNHLVRYNEYYPRWVYDEYRLFLSAWAEEQDYLLLDYWNSLSPQDFADQSVHRNSSGEEHFAELLAPEIKKMVCP